MTDAEKHARYYGPCEEEGILFFTFGIDVMGRLSDSAMGFMRWLTNS